LGKFFGGWPDKVLIDTAFVSGLVARGEYCWSVLFQFSQVTMQTIIGGG